MSTFATLPASSPFDEVGSDESWVKPPARAELTELLRAHTAWITLPPPPTVAVSRLPGLVRDIRLLTGWSQRELGEILHTSHTTVRRLETDGRVTARSRQSAARVTPLHGVLSRLAKVARTPERLATALATDSGRGTPAQLLREGQWSRAFTAALDALNGPRPAMLAPHPSWAPPRAATREIRH